jgi:hypothetical protein
MDSSLSKAAPIEPRTPPLNPWVLPDSGLALFHGHRETTRLFHYFLPRLIEQGKRILCLDGGNRFDPLLIARFARHRGLPPAEFNQRIRVARAFTCFQLTELLLRAPKFLPAFSANALIITALPDLYFDEDVREREACTSFERALEGLTAVPCPVAVFSGADSFRTPRQSLFRLLRAQADQVCQFTVRADGRLMLVSEKAMPQMALART